MEKPRKVIKNSNGLLILLTLFSIALIAGISLWSYDFYMDLQARQAEIQTKIDRTLEQNLNAQKEEVEKKVIVREVPLQTNESENLEETVSNLANRYDQINKETTDNILNQFANNEQLVQEMITNIQKQIDQIKEDGTNQEEVLKLQKMLEELKNSLKELEKEGDKDQNSLKSKIENLVEALEKYQEEIEILKKEIETTNKEIETINKDLENLLQIIKESQTKIEQILNDFSGLSARLDEVEKKVLECFQSVSDGKKILAAAITDKGIQTAATDPFSVMAQNVKGLITMSSNPNVLFDINSWTAPEDCIVVMSFSVTMECNSNYKQTSTVTLSGVRDWKFEWGPMSSSDTGWHTRGTSGNCTFQAKKGQTYTLSFDPGTSDYLVYGWGPRTWIVPKTSGYSVMSLSEEGETDFYQKVLEAESSPEYNRLLENSQEKGNTADHLEEPETEGSKTEELKTEESKEEESKTEELQTVESENEEVAPEKPVVEEKEEKITANT